ncbi:type VII secretion protein EccE [Dactylosporangium sp. NPDC048998]|uniref:type VII secretion protein EccE n=1 Tax=Dactylosporangium sp. NPDC048998 TaxID=3363976 RepID=UPI00371F2CC4
MRETAGGARAVARVAATPQPPPGTPEIRPAKRAGQLGRVHILQLLVVEALVVGVLMLLGKDVVVVAVAGAVAALLGVATLARRDGRWWLEQWAIARVFRRRQAATPPAGGADDDLAGLRLLAPGLTVTELGRSHPELDSQETADIGMLTRDAAESDGPGRAGVIAVARDAAGWYAVAELDTALVTADVPGAGVPLAMLARTLAATGQAGVLLQVVTQVTPALSASPQAGTQANRSYQELIAQVGAGPKPVNRASWLVVRLEAQLLAVAGAARDVTDEAPVVVAALLRRAVRTLERAGFAATPLDRPGLVAALHQGCGLEGGPDAPREEWDGWSGGQLTHVTYWISEWPEPARVPALVRGFSTIPATQTTLATIVAVPAADPTEDVPEPPLDEVGLRCLARVTAPAPRIGEVHALVMRWAEDGGAQLRRLDGEHAPAVYATAPTGGGRW